VPVNPLGKPFGKPPLPREPAFRRRVPPALSEPRGGLPAAGVKRHACGDPRAATPRGAPTASDACTLPPDMPARVLRGPTATRRALLETGPGRDASDERYPLSGLGVLGGAPDTSQPAGLRRGTATSTSTLAGTTSQRDPGRFIRPVRTSRPASHAAHNPAYTPPAATSSPCVPASMIRPCSITTIRSHAAAWESR
jgi:hypothetical protein